MCALKEVDVLPLLMTISCRSFNYGLHDAVIRVPFGPQSLLVYQHQSNDAVKLSDMHSTLLSYRTGFTL
jgi:hypothetical protein